MVTPLNVASGAPCSTMIAPTGTVLRRSDEGAVGAAAGESDVASQPPSATKLANEMPSVTRRARSRDGVPAGRTRDMKLLTGRGRGPDRMRPLCSPSLASTLPRSCNGCVSTRGRHASSRARPARWIAAGERQTAPNLHGAPWRFGEILLPTARRAPRSTRGLHSGRHPGRQVREALHDRVPERGVGAVAVIRHCPLQQHVRRTRRLHDLLERRLVEVRHQ